MEKLTPPQLKLIHYLYENQEKKKPTPTFREMAKYMNYSAVGSVQDLLKALLKKGLILKSQDRNARSVQLSEDGLRIVAKKHGYNAIATDDILAIPCLGKVPAGDPIEALEDKIGEIAVSSSLIPAKSLKGSSLFALKASGDSMELAGIHNGDWLIVKSKKSVDSGKIIIAKLEDGTATVKRLMKNQQKGWYLKPENPKYQPIYASQKKFEVIGEVLALQRSL